MHGPPLAGMLGLASWKFIFLHRVGVLIWSATFVAVGSAFRTQLAEPAEIVAPLGAYLVAALVSGLGGYITFKYLGRRRIFRDLQVARITPVELFASAQAPFQLKRRGVHRVRPFEGGFDGWLKLGFLILVEALNPRPA